MHNYIGKDVQLIYIDKKRNVSIRRVRILVVGAERFKAYCYQANNIRTFLTSGVVDVEALKYREGAAAL